jgi:carbonic anhydrase/acetyltransferase-like protein (isoleucine patch superfamily)
MEVKMIIKYRDKKSEIHKSSYITSTAQIIGAVTLNEDTSIWFGCVLRADLNSIIVGKNTNIQDNCVIHVRDEKGVSIGESCTIEHSVIINAATIGNNVFIGAGTIILDGAIIEDNVYICSGSIVPPRRIVPSNSLAIGSPFKVKRSLIKEEEEYIKESADRYVQLKETYRE